MQVKKAAAVKYSGAQYTLEISTEKHLSLAKHLCKSYDRDISVCVALKTVQASLPLWGGKVGLSGVVWKRHDEGQVILPFHLSS